MFGGWRKGLMLGAAMFGGMSACAEETATESSGVVEVLTTANFDEFIAKNPVTLVKFMAPWCGHCKKLAPEYEAAAKELKAEGIPLAEVDATQEAALAEKYKVSGFPTMYLFRNGEPEPYSGGRTKDTIIDWIKKMTGPAVEWFDKEADAVAAAKKTPVAFVGAFKDKKDAEVFEKVAEASRQSGKFIAYTSSTVEKAKVEAVRQNEENTPASSLTEADLKQFIADESLPLFGLVGGENYSQYLARSANWLWMAGSKEDFEKYGDVIRKVSKNYRTEFNFVWLDVAQFKGHAEQALGLSTYPSIAVVFDDVKYHYPEEVSEKMTEKSVTKFLQNVKSGKAKKFFKSEPIPESNDAPVKVVVGANFAEMVLQKDKDVMLEIYAPWCGHCKKLAPIYEELAEQLAGDSNIVIAKLDGTANEITVPDFTFQGFPTLYFVKAGQTKPMPYEGGRTLEDLLKFIEKNASKPVKMAKDDSKDEL